MRIVDVARRHRGATGAILIAGLVVVAFGAYWFGPQHLFLDRTADESLPAGAAQGDVEGAVLAEGSFVSLAHESGGTARLVEVDGASFLRLEDLDVLSGPDLRVYLTAAPAGSDADAYGDAMLVADLGGLRANQGNLTYEIPSGVDLGRVRSVSIWCRRFSVGFGVAPLEPLP